MPTSADQTTVVAVAAAAAVAVVVRPGRVQAVNTHTYARFLEGRVVSCVQVALIAVVGMMLYKRRRNSAVVKSSWAAEAAAANVSHRPALRPCRQGC